MILTKFFFTAQPVIFIGKDLVAVNGNLFVSLHPVGSPAADSVQSHILQSNTLISDMPISVPQPSAEEVRKDLISREIIPGKREILQRFFKTGPGEYAEGDLFIGVTVPSVRKVSKLMAEADFQTIGRMLESEVHEHRLSGLLVLVEQYRKARRDLGRKREIKDFYLGHTAAINNWDLVDLSAPKILGEFVAETGDAEVLYRLSESADLWEQRIAIVATFALLRAGRTDVTTELSRRYLTHKHDLIHKASGWMLREMGKRVSEAHLLDFLDRYAGVMPRTMLRYSLEKLSADQRKYYMSLKTDCGTKKAF